MDGSKMSALNKPKKDPSSYELESQFILRLPPDCAAKLRSLLAAGSSNFKDKLSIELHPDMRHGSVSVNGQLLYAKLYDLPCILESLKTLDKKTFYKSADISQMLVCTYEPAKDMEWAKDENLSPKKRKEKEMKKYQWMHGITQPLKNVRRRRFRKTLKKKYLEDAPEIEKEVKRLFRQDLDAVHIKYEIVDEEVEKLQKKLEQKAANSEKKEPQTKDLGEHDIFGAALSSSDEEDDDEDEEDDDEEEEEEEDDGLANLDDSTRGMAVEESFEDDSLLRGNIEKPTSTSTGRDFRVEMSSGEVRNVEEENHTSLHLDDESRQIQALKDLEKMRCEKVELQRQISDMGTQDTQLTEKLQSILDSKCEELREKEEEYNTLKPGDR